MCRTNQPSDTYPCASCFKENQNWAYRSPEPATSSYEPASETFQHEIKALWENVAYDDKYQLNTQSGTQWDGFRHIAHMTTQTFYNGTKGKDIQGPEKDPNKCGIHHWAEHGIVGRGVLIDYWGYANERGILYGILPHLNPNKQVQYLQNMRRLNTTPSLSQSSKLVVKLKALTFAPPPKAGTSKSEIYFSSALDSSQPTTAKLPMLAQRPLSDPTLQARMTASAGLVSSKKKPWSTGSITATLQR